MELQNNQQVLQDIISKAWEDENFKQELINNPISTIEGFTGSKVELPEGIKVVFRDQSNPDYTYINIPNIAILENMDDLSLSDEQLEMVAGGEVGGTVLATISIFFASYFIGQKHKQVSEYQCP